MSLKTIIFIIFSFSFSSMGLAQEGFTQPFKAELKYETLSSRGTVKVVIGTDGSKPKTISLESSLMLQQVWEIQKSVTTTNLLDQFKKRLLKESFEIIFECDFKSCGAFEFRFNVNIVSEPNMHVDLGDYKFITLKGPEGNAISYITYIISKGLNVRLIQVNTFGKHLTQKNNKLNKSVFNKNWIPNFNDAKGSIILKGLKFKPGSSEILESDINILTNLANYLILNDTEKIILVGHTDASGGLNNNIVLSKERAVSVKKLFIEQFDVNPNQISTNGIGFLAPIASNETKLGREKNRRVEIIIMPKLN